MIQLYTVYTGFLTILMQSIFMKSFISQNGLKQRISLAFKNVNFSHLLSPKTYIGIITAFFVKVKTLYRKKHTQPPRYRFLQLVKTGTQCSLLYYANQKVGDTCSVKMSVLPEVIYRSSAVTIKIPIISPFFVEIEKPILRFIGNHKGSPKENNLDPPKKVGLTLHFTAYYKRTVISSRQSWREDRHGDQGKRVESQEINSHIHGQLISNRMPNHSVGKGQSFQPMVPGTGHAQAGE